MPKTDKQTGRFVKGNGGGPGRGNKRPVSATGAELLADMEAAYRTAETPGEKPGVTHARRLLKEDYTKYLTLYAKLGGGGKDAVEPAVLRAAAAAGPKELGVVELAERLLTEWEESDGRAGSAGSAVLGRPGVGGPGEDRAGEDEP